MLWSQVDRTAAHVKVLITLNHKNNLTIARGERGGTVGRRVFRNYYKGHMDKTKGEGGSRGGRWVWLGWGREVGRNADNCN